MTDANGNSPLSDDFYRLDRTTWVEHGYTNHGWIYQKIADKMPMPLILASTLRINAPTFAEWCRSTKSGQMDVAEAMRAAQG